MKRRLLVAALLAVSLVGCGQKIDCGTVYSKEHREAYTDIWVQPIYAGKSWIYIPHTLSVPESWEISIYRDEKDGRKTATYSVSEEVYRQYQIGDTFVAVQ